MNSKYYSSKEIYEQFGNEKIICGINNPNFKIKFINSSVYIIAFCVWVIAIIPNILFNPLSFINDLFEHGKFIPLLFIILFDFLINFYTLYFEDNNIILNSIFRKKKIIDISKYPRIYTKYHEYYDTSGSDTVTKVEYDLRIEQNNISINLNIGRIGGKKINLLLNSLQMKEKSEVSKSQWDTSANDREKIFFSLTDYLKSKKKIIGIKDTSKNIIIKKSTNIVFYFLSIIFILCICLSIYLLLINMSKIAGFVFAFVLVLIYVLITEYKDINIRISYPSENTIKINRYLLNFKDNDVNISLQALQTPSSSRKYDYILILFGISNKFISNLFKNNSKKIPLEEANFEKLEEFVNNLIFEEK